MPVVPREITSAGEAARPDGAPTAATVGGDDAPILVRYRLTRRDYLDGNREIALRSRGQIAITTFIGIGGVFMLLRGDPLGIALLLFAVVVATGLAAAPAVWYSTRQRPEIALSEVDLAIDEQGLRFRTPTTQTEQRWSTFRYVREGPSVLLLDYGTGVVMIVPRRAFDATGLARLRSLAATAGVLDERSRLRPVIEGVAIGLSAMIVFAGAAVLVVLASSA